MSELTPVCPCDGQLPAPPTNLPGLSQIAYRDGEFREFRRALLTPLNGEQELASPQGPAWRPGANGDLAVMLAEWWAYVADVLTFYNERIANQDYLRTADLPGSVKRLIQLLGYRTRPAIGATGTLAALVTPGQSALLPKGLQFQSKPGPGEEAQTFELDAATQIGAPDAVPAGPVPSLLPPNNDVLLLEDAVRNIRAGDLLLLRRRDDPAQAPVIVTVSQVSVEALPGGTQQTRLAVSLTGSVPTGLTAAQTSLSRSNQSIGLWTLFSGVVFPHVSFTVFHLASLVRQIRAADWVLFTAASNKPELAPALAQVTLNKDVIWDAHDPADPAHPLPVPHTQLTVIPPFRWPYSWDGSADSVSVLFDWIEVGRLKDQPPGLFTGTPPSLGAIQPTSFPTSTDRPVLLQDSAGAGMTASGTSSSGASLSLGDLPAPLPALQPPFSVLYNLLPVSRGKTVANEILGSGDATIAGQSFLLAKSPVTYLQKGATYASTIAITVDGQLWKEVASFYRQPADAHIFVTSEDESGTTHVSFGDGVNGARLPTGTNNIVATYRMGAGTASPAAGKLTVIAQSFPGLRSVLNPIAVSGGADADPADQIRQYAPRSVLTFGRAVSVFDYEAIAAQAPGVTRARAAWSWDDVRQRTAVTVYIGDDAGAVASAKSVLAAAGDPNRPVSVVLASAIPVFLLLAVVVTPGMDGSAIGAGVKSALADPQTGLFAPSKLRIGQPVFDSQIEAACLSVDGTVAVIASLFWLFGFPFGSADPGPLHIPPEGAYYALTQDRVFVKTEPDPNVPDDSYAARYADKLWQLLPAVYRTLDSGEDSSATGPLREMVDRIGAQMATVRRGIDRLWDNQSIETCDDWVIPYIGDLLATRMVSCLDARAQRLDVAKTIYYRRRSGTVGLLEELGTDIAGRDVRVVEFFRRHGRTRHHFDPPIGAIPAPFDPAAPPVPPVVEGLAGAYSRTPAGGFADLRNQYAALNTNSAFDEFAHTADLRHGTQSSGWYNISHLGVFIWWLQSFPIVAATPVSNGATPSCFTFDPTGRDVPLFAPSSRSAESFGEHWISPDEWELPVSVREVLWRTVPDRLYPAAFWVGLGGGPSPAVQPRTDVLIHPERGRFSFVGAAPQGTIVSTYHFGFLSEIGAGGYDERVLQQLPQPAATTNVVGGTGLDTALAAVAADATIEIGDTMTYPGPTATLVLPTDTSVALRAENQQRPVIRWAGAGPNAWAIEGNGNAKLTIQGIWLQGADVVLQGSFDTVRLRMATLDPGTSDAPSALFATAIDGSSLPPTTLWIEGKIGKLIIERCITGPIRARNGGAVEKLTATDSIIQSIPAHDIAAGAPVLDAADLAARVKSGTDPISTQIRAALSSADLAALEAFTPGTVPSGTLQAALAAALAGLDRATLEAAYPLALADLALGFASGTLSLSRCTVLGPTATHRMEASECILDEIARVEDPQHGCVRFCAYAQGSNLHAPYRSVAVLPRGPLLESRLFGRPNYGKLRRDVDAAILGPQPGDTIRGGAQNGAEIGAFCLERVALKRRGLALKFLEFMPINITPVWIDAD